MLPRQLFDTCHNDLISRREKTTGRRQSRSHLLGISGFYRYQVLLAGNRVN